MEKVIYSINGKKTSFEPRVLGFRFQEKQILNTETRILKSQIRNIHSLLTTTLQPLYDFKLVCSTGLCG